MVLKQLTAEVDEEWNLLEPTQIHMMIPMLPEATTEQQEDALPTAAASSPTSTTSSEAIDYESNQHEESTSTITTMSQFDKNISSRKSNVTIDNAADNNNNISATAATNTSKESNTMSTSITTDNSTLIPIQHHSPRRLPPKEITESNIADRYIEFVFYCNPSAPIETDVSSLQRAFQAVPKSDGKVFHPWVLFQLVRKHEAGEIRTWTKLAQQLGVEKTDDSSPQKIQQYAVRLKKWMRSIHLDAFFDYLLSKQNEYYLEPEKNPTGFEETSATTSTTATLDDDADDADLVLKLIKRANSKRKKRKYTRRNTGGSISGVGSNDIDNEEQQKQPKEKSAKMTTSSSKTARNEEPPEKRIIVSVSEASSGNDDEDDAAEPMEDDLQDVECDDPTLPIAHRRSIVQVGLGTRWVKDEEEDKYEDDSRTEASSSAAVASSSKHKDVTNKKKRNNNSKSSSPSKNNSSSRISSAPAREILLQLGKSKSFDHIPTPNPSPTTMTEMRYHHQHLGHSSLSSVAGFDRNTVDSSPSTSAASSNIKWRAISIGGGPSAPVTVSSFSPQKGTKRKYSSTDVSPTGHYDTFRVQKQKQQHPQHQPQPPQHQPQPIQLPPPTQQYPEHYGFGAPLPPSINSYRPSISSSSSLFTEFFLPPVNASSPDAVNTLTKRLTKAVEMLENSQRRIEQLESSMRQREDEIRRKFCDMKNDVSGLLKKWGD
ncbi:4584_t:CDS:2 [Ambispora gerdemannii]|uniref:4584_t:CDS:1 n=1 Tax=Ambispora gerdemannii TaxID=144530 RepID=A0A9N9AUV3_9GLOM|nr:4584_t:CDS:2 [Ambispora gerdemannii]